MARFIRKQSSSKVKQSVESVKRNKEIKLGWAKDYILALVRIVLAVAAVLVAKYATEYILELNNFYATWYIEFGLTTIIAIVILLTLGAAFPSNKNTKMTKRIVFGLMIVFLLGWYLLPAINERNFDQNNEPIKWVNLKTREVYHKNLNPVQDVNGEKFFLHPVNQDTCVLLTKEKLQKKVSVVRKVPAKVTPVQTVKWIYVYDTVFSEVHTSQGEFKTGLYGADILKGDIIYISNINKKGVASFRISKDTDIFVSSLNRNAKYKVKTGVLSGYKEPCIGSNSNGSTVRVQLIRPRRVKI